MLAHMGTVGRAHRRSPDDLSAESSSSWWARHPRSLHAVALAALLLGAVYLTWRIGWSGRGADLSLYVALLAAEIFGWLSLAFFVFLAWSAPRSTRPPLGVLPSIDVFVCTYDEPMSVVESTLVGCRAITVPHETYLLDDGNRLEMAELAARLGAHSVTRPDNSHAKAGNVNHALGVTGGELILMLDADHVPFPEIVEATAGYFEDPEVALVQTPHDFSNRDSVQHSRLARHEQTLFYSVIAPGKDRHNAMFWCGSATLLRRAALTQVGGVRYDTIAEDFHTTIAIHARGWRTHYHDEVLVQGLAPHDLAGFLLQRARWARGNLAVFRTPENPITCRGLRPAQRLSYTASLLNYFSGLQRFALLAVLIATLASGHLPMHATVMGLAAFWLPWSVLAFVATVALGRGALGPLDSTRYGLLTMGIYMRGIAALLSKRVGKFKVTPKEGIDTGGLRVLRMEGLLSAVGIALLAAWILRMLQVVDVLDIPAMPTFATVVVIALGVWELFSIGRAVTPLVQRRQVRARYRTEVSMQGRIAGTRHLVDVVDLSVDGIAFETTALIPVGGTINLLTRLPDVGGTMHDMTLPLEVRAIRRARNHRIRVGCRFRELNDGTRRRLVEFCDVIVPLRRLDPEGQRRIELATQHRPIRWAAPRPDAMIMPVEA
jgi:cellulose synthase (UDP-forming)